MLVQPYHEFALTDAYQLMQGDAAYGPDYATTYIAPRLASLMERCGPETPAGGETPS